MIGRAAQGNPWVLREIRGLTGEPSREEVVAELLLFIRETVRELGERRASGFLKKFYAWYLGRGRVPEAVQAGARRCSTAIAEVERRLLAAAPGAPSCSSGSRELADRSTSVVARLAADLDLRRRLARAATATASVVSSPRRAAARAASARDRPR